MQLGLYGVNLVFQLDNGLCGIGIECSGLSGYKSEKAGHIAVIVLNGECRLKIIFHARCGIDFPTAGRYTGVGRGMNMPLEVGYV